MAIDNLLIKIFNSRNEELKELISKRYKELNEKVLNNEHHHNEINCIEDEFIPDYLEIFVNEMSFNTYSLKGIDYLDYCNYLKDRVDVNKSDYMVNLLLDTINYVRRYFSMDFRNNEKDVREMLLEYDYNKNRNIDKNYVSSISIFKDNGTGRCLEHALLMQNLLSFIGVSTSFFSTIQKTDEKICGHCFNVVHINDKNILIDLVNVDILENGQPRVVLKEISDEEYSLLRNGEMIEVERKDATRENGKKVSQYILLDSYNKGKRFSGTEDIIKR